MKLRVLIADDEPLARQRLRDLLREESDVEIVGECGTGKETIEAVRSKSPDLLLLDIRMPEMDGFEVMRALAPDRLPVVIFVTAHDEFALRAFEAHAVDYLLKPFDRMRFRQAISHARDIIKRGQSISAADEIMDLLMALKGTSREAARLSVRVGDRIVLVRLSEIDWIQGADNYSELHLGGTVRLVRRTIKALEAELPARQFVRISRSVIVNVDRIREIRTRSHGDYAVILHDSRELRASRNYRVGLLALLGKLD